MTPYDKSSYHIGGASLKTHDYQCIVILYVLFPWWMAHLRWLKGKGKVHPRTGHKGTKGE
jgi:hypothetical protein